MFLRTSHSLLLNTFKTFARDRRKIKLSCVYRRQGFSSEGMPNPDRRIDLGDRYTAEDRDVILRKINTSTTEELKKYKITENRLKKITAYRDKHGPFKSVEDVLLFQGMDASVLDRFCKSMVTMKATPKSRNVRPQTILLNSSITEAIKYGPATFTGICVRANFISWAQVDRNYNLLDWKCQFLELDMKGGLIVVVEAVANIIANVPKSEVYILESDPIIPFSRVNCSVYLLQLHRQQIVSTIVSILGTREKPFDGESTSMINNICMLRSRTAARLFNLLIGTEIVSTRDVVEKIINGHGRREQEDIFQIYADLDVKNYYRNVDIYRREQMNWALLLTSAFFKLHIVKAASPAKNTSGDVQNPKKSNDHVRTIV